MGNHWHIVVWPEEDGQLSKFVGWLTLTHTQRWHQGSAEQKRLLSAWPVRRSSNWVDHVKLPLTDEELAAIQRSLDHGCPFGDDSWFAETARILGLEIKTRARGRPKFRTIGS